jgi:hypothetical protein
MNQWMEWSRVANFQRNMIYPTTWYLGGCSSQDDWGFCFSDFWFLTDIFWKKLTLLWTVTRDFGSVDLNGPKDGRPSEYECSFFFRSMSCGFVLGWRHYPGEWVYDLNYCSYKLDLHSRSVFFIFLLCQELNEDIEASIPFIVYIHIYTLYETVWGSFEVCCLAVS